MRYGIGLLACLVLASACTKAPPPPPPPPAEVATTFLLGELNRVDRVVVTAPGSPDRIEWQGDYAFRVASALTWAERLSEGATAECRPAFHVDVYAGAQHLATVEADLEHCRTVITGEPPRKVRTGVLASALRPVALTFAPPREWVVSPTFALDDRAAFRGLSGVALLDRPLETGVQAELVWRVSGKEAPRSLTVSGVHEGGERVELRMLDERRSAVIFPAAGLWRLDVSGDGNLLANIVIQVEPSGSH